MHRKAEVAVASRVYL